VFDRVARTAKVLSHPLTLLLAGAVLTSIVVPAITRSWQDHEKELAVKSQLVEGLTAKTSEFLAAIQFARIGREAEDGKAANDAYKQFLVDSAVVGSRLSARFPNTSLAARWRAYSRLVEDLYSLGSASNESQVATRPHDILAAYQRTAEPLSEQAEAERRRLIRVVHGTFEKEWAGFYGEVLGQRDAIAQAILDADDVAI